MFIKIVIRKIVRYLRISDLLHSLLVRTDILKKMGLLGFGEARSNRINPFFLTLNAIESDYKLIFREDTKLPFENSSLKVIYSSHNLEHLDYKTAENFFKESYRTLRKGGELSIEVPNMELVYNSYKKYIEEGDFSHFEPFMHQSGFSVGVNQTIRRHQGLQAEEIENRLKEPSIHFAQYIANYLDPPFIGPQTPIIIEPKKFNEFFDSMEMDDFFYWYASKLTEDQKKSGGHISSWYPSKLINQLNSLGFSTELRGYKESRSINGNGFFVFIPDRDHRSHNSFRVSALKL